MTGYASSIVRLAEWMNAEGKPLPSVKRIWTTSEMLTPEGREAIRAAFGFEPREAYASVEFGFMGWQAVARRPVQPRNRPADLRRRGRGLARQATAGEVSRVVVSDLLNDTTPLLRYDIGDLATMGTPMPLRHRATARSRNSAARATTSICDASGRRIEPFALLGCLKETLGAAQYRLICVERGLLVLQYRPARNAADRIDAVLEGLRGIVGEPIRIVAQEVPAIKRENSGKLRPIIDLSGIAGAGRDASCTTSPRRAFRVSDIDLAT